MVLISFLIVSMETDLLPNYVATYIRYNDICQINPTGAADNIHKCCCFFSPFKPKGISDSY